MDARDIVKHIPLFDGLPEKQLEILAASAREKSYAPGQTIFVDTQEAQAFYLVVWGRVKIFKSTLDGKEQTIFLFGPGEPFCLTSLTDEFSPASAMALDDTRIIIEQQYIRNREGVIEKQALSYRHDQGYRGSPSHPPVIGVSPTLELPNILRVPFDQDANRVIAELVALRPAVHVFLKPPFEQVEIVSSV